VTLLRTFGSVATSEAGCFATDTNENVFHFRPRGYFRRRVGVKLQIDDSIENGGYFVVGDAFGADQMSLNYLWDKQIEKVVIYHMHKSPLFDNPGFPTKGGYKNHRKKDSQMTKDSDFDIAWVRSDEESEKLYGRKYNPGRISGTQKNINRRSSAQKK
jgi:hypothetical protein